MDKCRQEQEASSIDINMTEQEEDIICRMHKLVGDKWALIAGRVPGKTPEEIERFWLMKNNNNNVKGKRMENKREETKLSS